MRRFLLPLLLINFLLLSCESEEAKTSSVNKNTSSIIEDSTTIRIAILPTIDCLPLYLAANNGVYDSLRISVCPIIYRSQMDAEQSLIEGKTEGCATDLLRVGWLQQQKAPLRYVFNTSRQWELIANKMLRISKVEQLSDRMVGMERHAVTDYLCDVISGSLRTGKMILRPQINNLWTRTDMLENQQIDAALLPQPYALAMRKKGHSWIPLKKAQTDELAGFAFSSKFLAQKQSKEKIHALVQGYNQVVKQLNQQKHLHLDKTTTLQFGLTDIIDSIRPNKAFFLATSANNSKESWSIEWLRNRNLLMPSYKGDTLIYK